MLMRRCSAGVAHALAARLNDKIMKT